MNDGNKKCFRITLNPKNFKSFSNEELGILFRQILNYITLCKDSIHPPYKYLQEQLPTPMLKTLFEKYVVQIRKQQITSKSQVVEAPMDELITELNSVSKNTMDELKK